MTSLVQGAKLKTLNHADQLIEQYIDNEKYKTVSLSNVIHRN